MARRTFASDDVARPRGPYSSVTSCGPLVTTAGIVGTGVDGVLVEGLEEQVHASMRNMMAALRAAGAVETDIVAVNVFLADGEHVDRMNAVFTEWVHEPFPARTTIVAGLRAGVLFEINATAYVTETEGIH